MKLLLKTLVVLLVLVLAGGAFVWSGAYDIGADAPHWTLTERLLDALRERSIERRAEDVQVPSNLDDPALLAEGAEHYDAMCTGCHLAPGMDETEIRAGLYPQPPKLAEGSMGDPREAFWAIKHGVKLTAMPAWGKTHDDAKIWAMVAFLRKLPSLTPEQYRQITGNAGEGDAHEHHDGHEEAAPPADHDHDAHDGAGHDHAAPAATAGAPAAEAAVQAFHEALQRGDREAALARLAEDVQIAEGGSLQRSRAAYAAAHLGDDMAFLQAAQVRLLSRHSALDGDRAWVASEMETRAQWQGKPIALRGSETVLLRQGGSGWTIAAIHWAAAPLASP
ncbi:MAG: c-type cytochrome [Mizugakiibacter sp.]|uniref:c-type cytochrome n=1 Tax=Mizugakiibacter sp. TaxID=1972610 RepID=UPI0031C553B2|nr:c-type cytochrome [Xanthomonadaceae bacterium]